MSTLRANTLKPITSGNSLVLQGDSGGSGVSGPSIDSNGDVDFSQNTNAKIKLPSGGGIYESDGSTEILTESGGVVSLKNTTIDSSATFPGPPSAGTFKGGHIIQVVNFELTGGVQVSSSTFSDTGLTASITPASASHKILIQLVHNTVYKNTNNTWANFSFHRDATSLFNFAEVLGYDAGTGENNVGAAVLNYLDSPNTTSSVTYKTQINSNGDNANAGFNRNGSRSYITLMEVVA